MVSTQMSSPQSSFDFVIVGGGTSGSVLASRLANSAAAPSVLLIEAGGDNSAEELRSIDLRYSVAQTPGLDWAYQSSYFAQKNDKVQPYLRGKGLGGSSVTNYGFWIVGAKEDYDLWAEKVGDDSWKWDGESGVKARLRKIENLHVGEEHPDYTGLWDSAALKDHSQEGKLDITYFKVPEKDSLEAMGFDAAKEVGLKFNGDLNSGDPAGLGVAPSTMNGSLRSSAAVAYLYQTPSNLRILTNTAIAKVLFDGKKAIGVQSSSGEIFHATKEVIVSAGTFDTPKLLLLSGVGPRAELSSLSIPVVHDLPGVGKHLIDHVAAPLTIILKPDLGFNTGDARAAQVLMGWFKSESITSSPESKELPATTLVSLKSLPSYEIFLCSLPLALGTHVPLPNDRFISFGVTLMNAQSEGSITLASSDPSVPPRIDLNYLSHPYDQRVAIESYRESYPFMTASVFASRTQAVLGEPPTDKSSDEEILAYWQKTATTVSHCSGTCKMGKDGDDGVVTDSSFRVVGLENLRVVDLSVSPVIPNNHTQSTAYLVGETAAEKLVKEYKLE